MRISYKRVSVVFGLVVTCSLLAFAGPASAAPAGAAPAWSVRVTSYPTIFEPNSEGATPYANGPGYLIRVMNVGGAATSGTFTVGDELPGGISPAADPPVVLNRNGGGSSTTCEVNGSVMSCTASVALQPGEYLAVLMPVKVEADADQVIDRATVSGGGAATSAAVAATTRIGSGLPVFDFMSGAEGLAYDTAVTPEGLDATQAGSHPGQLGVAMSFPSIQGTYETEYFASGGGLKTVSAALPKGMVVNPTATPVRCTETELETEQSGGGCPAASQVGTAVITTNLIGPNVSQAPIFNMMPPVGTPAEMGFDALGLGIYVHLRGEVRSDGDYGLSASSTDILSRPANPILGVEVSLWGDPSAESHDAERGECGEEHGGRPASCPVTRRNVPFLTLPSACSGPLTLEATATDWLEPETAVRASAQTEDINGNPVGVTGCSVLPFAPTLSLKPEVSTSDSPTGLEVDLHVPQNPTSQNEAGEPQLASANLKDVKVTLPEGLAVDPSAAAGLSACTEAEFELHGGEPAECPDAATLGTVEVDTPLVDHPLPGAVYLATPHENPFGSLLALYIAVHDPKSGVVVKLAGKVELDPSTGRLTTTFLENPELPFEDFKLDFFGGPRAALRTPAVCGSYASNGEFTPWSGTAPVSGESPFSITQGAGGSACAAAAAEPNAPAFEAGTTAPLAGSYSPFELHLTRGDGSQQFGAVDVTLPPGLTGKLADIPYCSDAAIAAAAGNAGAEEQQRPSCPSSSEVGTVTVGAGSGPQPYYVQGHAYLAGPYKGAPLSLVIVTPAVAGPFDLGTVVVRAALFVNPDTAQVTVKSDPIPSILQGIPLDIRSIAVSIDRSGFTLNPTNCEPMSVTASETSTLGQTAALSSRFQVGGCQGLAFKPALSASTQGQASKPNGASLVVKIATKAGEANIHKVNLQLPVVLPSRLTTLQKSCTEAQFNANPAGCPAGSVIGSATANTPILQAPLTGPGYLVSHGGAAFPDVEFVLQAQERDGVIEIVLDGHTQIKKGITYSSFETVPDAPVTSFETVLPQGPHSILAVNLPASAAYSLCGRALRMPTMLTAQTGAVLKQSTPVTIEGCPTTLSFKHEVKQKALTLIVYAPAAGKISATGKGLSTQSKTAKGQENLTITLTQKRAGRQKTGVRVTFTPSTGKTRKKQTKTAKLTFKR